ncbi:MAG: hypothetical protein K8F35_04365 [Dokdonella sp.]|uniref:hypothetical protein n=1 Tax=Dokdonella sp. TaxID=2291710 RepID=UPI0025BD64F0|nr:hypothetical protein [Dokdonella sp.]MBZ0222242.1 hypothetical protein [Dokdonella sp.]
MVVMLEVPSLDHRGGSRDRRSGANREQQKGRTGAPLQSKRPGHEVSVSGCSRVHVARSTSGYPRATLLDAERVITLDQHITSVNGEPDAAGTSRNQGRRKRKRHRKGGVARFIKWWAVQGSNL